jgi:hypothetical protein
MSNVPDDLPVVVFFEDRHAYYSPTHGKLTGMTSLIGHWTPEFQRDYWLSNAAFKAVLGEDRWREIKNERWKGIIAPPKEFYFTMWEEMNSDQRALFREEKKKVEVEWELKNAYACMYGSRYHAKRESEDIEAGGAVHPVTGEFMEIPMMPDKRHGDNAALAENLYDLPDGYYPELLIHDLEAGVCGMVDRAWLRTQDSIRYFAFKDYKTNKKKGGFETLLPPSIISLQINLHNIVCRQAGTGIC